MMRNTADIKDRILFIDYLQAFGDKKMASLTEIVNKACHRVKTNICGTVFFENYNP
jgi:hypothetical protein